MCLNLSHKKCFQLFSILVDLPSYQNICSRFVNLELILDLNNWPRRNNGVLCLLAVYQIVTVITSLIDCDSLINTLPKHVPGGKDREDVVTIVQQQPLASMLVCILFSGVTRTSRY